jgi:MFS family permease
LFVSLVFFCFVLFCFLLPIRVINNLVFHGLGLRSNDLGISPYLTFALSALVELICAMFTFELLQYNARRKPYIFLILITGICCTSVYFSSKSELEKFTTTTTKIQLIKQNFQLKISSHHFIGNIIFTVLMALSAKFSISASYAIIRSYSSELFPEFKRKTYISTCSYMARLGSIIAPFIIGFVWTLEQLVCWWYLIVFLLSFLFLFFCLLILKGDYYFKQLPFLIFGISCFVSAIFSIVLPNIRNENLPPTTTGTVQQLLQNKY